MSEENETVEPAQDADAAVLVADEPKPPAKAKKPRAKAKAKKAKAKGGVVPKEETKYVKRIVFDGPKNELFQRTIQMLEPADTPIDLTPVRRQLFTPEEHGLDCPHDLEVTIKRKQDPVKAKAGEMIFFWYAEEVHMMVRQRRRAPR